jgi:hypothetical protein
MRVLQLLKIPYAAVPDLLLHLKILHKLPLQPKNPPSTQPLGHHSPHCSPPHVHSPKSPPHTTPPLQNLPTEPALQHRSHPYVHSPKSPPHTIPPPQNPPTEQALQHHSSPHVHSPKSPPHTIPPLQNPPNAPKKQDAIVDEARKDPKTVVEKFYDCLKNYETKKLLEDLVVEGMTIEEFWQHSDKDFREFKYRTPLVPKHIYLKFLWIMQKFHEWYFLACVYELNFVEAKIHGDIFNTLDFDLNVELVLLHTIFHLQMLNITMMTVWCM